MLYFNVRSRNWPIFLRAETVGCVSGVNVLQALQLVTTKDPICVPGPVHG